MEYVLAIIVGLGGGWVLIEVITGAIVARQPAPPGRDAEPVSGGLARVTRDFVARDGAAHATGAVEIHGAQWNAESVSLGAPLRVGDPVRVTGRRGLILLVVAEPAPATSQPR